MQQGEIWIQWFIAWEEKKLKFSILAQEMCLLPTPAEMFKLLLYFSLEQKLCFND